MATDPTTTPAQDGTPPTFWQKYGQLVYKLIFAVAGLFGGVAVCQPGGKSCTCPPPAPVVNPTPDPAPPPAKGKHRYGWKASKPEAGDPQFSLDEPVPTPERVMIGEPSVRPAAAPAADPFGPAYDQGQLGSCGPNACSKLIRYCMSKAGNPSPPDPSRLFIYYNTRALMGTTRQDSGVENRYMLQAVARYGWCDESAWAYNIRKFTTKPPASCYTQGARRKVADYGTVPQNLASMRQALASGHPFIFGFTVYESFESDAVAATGVVPMPADTEGILGGHDVLFVGYDDATQRFTFLNSWGTGWGKNGYGTIPYAYATNPGLANDFWTIRTTPAKLAPPADGLGRLRLQPEPALAF